MKQKRDVTAEIIAGSTPEANARRGKHAIIKPRHRAILERMKGGETITGAMIAMSYAPRTVNEPSTITKSKSWQALMEEQLPEDVVARRHRELLDKRLYRTVYTGRGKNRKEERVDDGVDPSVIRAVELAYKLRGRTKDEAPPADRPNIYNLFYQPTVQASVKAFEDTLKQTIAHEVDRPDIVDVRPSADEPSATSEHDTGGVGAGEGATSEGDAGR